MCINRKVTVCYLRPEDCHQIIIKVIWYGKHFDITIVKGDSGLIGTMTEDMVVKISEQLGTTVDDYISTCKSALAEAEGSFKFIYNLTKNEFQWKKVAGNIKVIFGFVKLTAAPCVDKLHDIVNVIRTQNNELKQTIGQLQKDKQVLESNHRKLLETVDECVTVKRNLENVLFHKFLVLLNSKKKRIEELESKLMSVNSRDRLSSENESDETNDDIQYLIDCKTEADSDDYNTSGEEKMETRGSSSRKRQLNSSDLSDSNSKKICVMTKRKTRSSVLRKANSKSAPNEDSDSDPEETPILRCDENNRVLKENDFQTVFQDMLDKGCRSNKKNNSSKKSKMLKNTSFEMTKSPCIENDEHNDRMILVEEVEGLTPGSIFYHDGNGFFFRKSRESENCIWLKCRTGNCCAAATLYKYPRGNRMIRVSAGCSHNHDPDVTRMQIVNFRKKLSEKSKYETTSLEMIYDEAIQGLPEDIVAQFPFTRVKKTMQRTRRRQSFENRSMVIDKDNDIIHLAEEVEGQTTELGVYYDGGGYFYNKDRENESCIWLRCCIDDCSARVTMKKCDYEKELQVATRSSHSHEPDVTRMQVVHLRKTMLERSRRETIPLRKIYDKETRGLPKEIVAQLPYGTLKKLMQGERKRIALENTTSADDWSVDNDEDSHEYNLAELVEGQRAGSFIYHDGEGFFYNRNRGNDIHVWLRCCNTGCGVRAIVRKSRDGKQYIRITGGSHNHEADINRKQVMQLRRKLLERSRYENSTLKSIYEEEMRGLPERVVVQLPYYQVKKGMQRARRMMTMQYVEEVTIEDQDHKCSNLDHNL